MERKTMTELTLEEMGRATGGYQRPGDESRFCLGIIAKGVKAPRAAQSSAASRKA